MNRSAQAIVWLGVAALMAVLVIVGCGSKGGSSTTGPSSQNTLQVDWPTDATGLYSVKVEIERCGLVACTWDSTDAYDVPVCGTLFNVESDTSIGLIINSVDGIVADTAINVTIDATIRVDDETTCGMIVTISTEETGQPPSREGWQYIYKTRFTGCPQAAGFRLRYTFTRKGSYPCPAPSGKISMPRWRFPGITGT